MERKIISENVICDIGDAAMQNRIEANEEAAKSCVRIVLEEDNSTECDQTRAKVESVQKESM